MRLSSAPVVVLSLFTVLIACSSSSSGGGSAGGNADAGADGAVASDAGADASQGPSDAHADVDCTGSGVPGACVAFRTSCGGLCAAQCDVRLTLSPSNDRFCTVTCSDNTACAPLGANLACLAAVGVCTPSCTTDAGCLALGWKRCDITSSACDTQ